MISIRQIDAGLALLGLNRSKLASELGLNKTTLNSYFTGQASIPLSRLTAIQGWLESAGIQFIEGGARLRQSSVRELKGQQGFWAFYDDVYETIKREGGYILVNNVNEDLFLKWLGDKKEEHDRRMSDLNNYKTKVLLCEGDDNFAANYGDIEYRWTPKDRFSDIAFFLYGSKTAIIEFSPDDAWISVIDSPRVHQAFQASFFAAWQDAIIVPEK